MYSGYLQVYLLKLEDRWYNNYITATTMSVDWLVNKDQLLMAWTNVAQTMAAAAG